MDLLSHPPLDYQTYRRHFQRPAYWQPLLDALREQTGMRLPALTPASPLGTHPTFLSRERVVKLYTPLMKGELEWEIELAMLQALEGEDVPVSAPLSWGELRLQGSAYWYLIQSRLPGLPFSAGQTGLGPGNARRLGDWISRLHRLPPPAQLSRRADYSAFLAGQQEGITQLLLRRASLSLRLREDAPAFLARWLPPAGPVVACHSDLHHHHLLGSGRPWRLEGLIDFGDARLATPFYELGPLAASVLRQPADRRAFLQGYGWEIPEPGEFARAALATALCHDYDIFEALGERREADSLAELAERLFALE